MQRKEIAAAEASLATALAERDHALETARKYREKIEDMQAILESVNALAREFGFGQGELNDDLADCLRQAFRRENEAARQEERELEKMR